MLMFVAVPSQAADLPPSIPGTIIENAAGSGNYSTDSKLSCAPGAASIMDCTYFGELTGQKYITLLQDSMKSVEDGGHIAPLSITAEISLYYDSVGNNDPNDFSEMNRFVPVIFDTKTQRAFFSYKLADFYFDAGTSYDKIFTNNNGSSYIGSSGRCVYGKENKSNPDVVAQSLEDSLYSVGVRCTVFGDGLDLAAMFGGSGPWVTSWELKDPSKVKGLFVSLHKSLTLISPKLNEGYMYDLMGADNGTMVQDGGLRGGGFPFSENLTAARVGCSVSYPYISGTNGANWYPNKGLTFRDFESGPFGDVDSIKTASVSGAVMFNWVSYTPETYSCFRVNSERYKAPSAGSDWVSSPDNVITDEDLKTLIESAVPSQPDPGTIFIRGEFTDCVNIDPFNFKWDWPCVMDYLFVVSPAAQAGMQGANQELLKRFPFNYLPMLFDVSSKMFGDPGNTCKPITIDMAGVTLPLVPCDQAFANTMRPLTGWLFSFMICFWVGTWVLQKFMPSTPGSDS
jgi:hypothetical protein